MGKVIQTVEQRLNEAFSLSRLEIRNDSHLHKGHNNDAAREGAETHLHITLKVEGLEGLSRLEKHQTVMRLLADLMPHPLHSVSLKVL